LHFVNPVYYGDIVIKSNDVSPTNDELSSFVNNLINTRVELPLDEEDEIVSARMTSDLTRPEDGETDDRHCIIDETEDILENLEPCPDLNIQQSTLLNERFGVKNHKEVMTDVLEAFRKTVYTDQTRKGTGVQCEKEPVPLYINRSENPLNDYMDRNKIIYGGFPTVFPLGTGLGPGKGPVDLKTRKFLLRHFSRRIGQNHRLLMYLFNVKYRSDAGRVMAAQVRTNPSRLQAFYDFVNDPKNEKGLAFACDNPESEEVTITISIIHITDSSTNVH